MKTVIIAVLVVALIISTGVVVLEKNRPDVIINNTLYTNTTAIEYREITTTEYINITNECESIYPQVYVDRIIYQYEVCKNELIFLNKTDLRDENYDLNISFSRCEAKLEEMENILR